jgi:secreted trypsin-like serine protease
MSFIVIYLECFSLGTTAREWSVGVGIQDQKQVYGSNIIHASHIYVNEHYDSDKSKNDIALIKLNKKIDITGK